MSLIGKIKSAAKSPLQKIAHAAETQIQNTISSKLAKARSSINSIEHIAHQIDDTLTSGGDAGFFSRTGIASERASADEIIDSRFASNLDAKQYSTMVIPQGKMAGSKTSGNVIQYPPDLGEYYLTFNFMKYERPNRFKAATTKSEFVIHLPIPAQLNEVHAMDWRGDTQGMIGNLADHIEAGADAEGSLKAGILAGAYQTGYAAEASIIRHIPIINQLGTDKAIDIIGQELGAIPNPHISMIFQGPVFRDFSFAWKFHPHSADESKLIKAIVSEFRKRALPSVAFNDTQDLIGYPDIVEVTLNVGDRKNEYLYPMKKCAIGAFTVNYAPNGTPSSFAETKAPTFIEFSVSLKEIEYFLAEDFGRDPSTTSIEEVAGSKLKKLFGGVTEGVFSAAKQEAIDSQSGSDGG